MRTPRIEIKADSTAYAHICKVAWFAVENWQNKMTNMVDSNKEAKIHFTNIGLVEFSIQAKMSLADCEQETHHK